MANFSESVAEPNPTVGRGFTATVKPTALDDQKISKGLPSGYLTWPWKDPPFLRTVNHLFLWAIYTMAMLVITRGYQKEFFKIDAENFRWVQPIPTKSGQMSRHMFFAVHHWGHWTAPLELQSTSVGKTW